MPPSPRITDTAARLSRLLGPLRRKVLRRSREAGNLPDLPEAQVEVLRTLGEHGPRSSSQVAELLRLARPSVSNLLTTMTNAGLTKRASSEDDLRVVLVSLTPRAKSLLRRYDTVSTATLAEALKTMSARDRAVLAEAVEVLERLLGRLDGM